MQKNWDTTRDRTIKSRFRLLWKTKEMGHHKQTIKEEDERRKDAMKNCEDMDEGICSTKSWWKISYSLKDILWTIPDVIYAWWEYYRLMIFAVELYRWDEYMWDGRRWWYYSEWDELRIICQHDSENLRDLIELIADDTQEYEKEVPQRFKRNLE